MTAFSRLCFFLLLACLFACSPAGPAATPAWDNAHVANLHLQLVDPEYVQDISFSADGRGTGAFGDKRGVTPVIIYWRISRGRLALSTYDNPIDELSLVSESDEYVIARGKSGKILKYRKLGR